MKLRQLPADHHRRRALHSQPRSFSPSNCTALSSVTPLNCAANSVTSNLRSARFGLCIFSRFAMKSIAAFSDSTTSNAFRSRGADSGNTIPLNSAAFLNAIMKSVTISSDLISSNACRRGTDVGCVIPLNFAVHLSNNNLGVICSEFCRLSNLETLRCFPFSCIFYLSPNVLLAWSVRASSSLTHLKRKLVPLTANMDIKINHP